jgi:hypothetical protein
VATLSGQSRPAGVVVLEYSEEAWLVANAKNLVRMSLGGASLI